MPGIGRGRVAAGVAAFVAAGLVAGAPAARADESAEAARIRRLEEALERQASDLRALRGELARVREESGPATLTADEIRGALDAYLATSAPYGRPMLSTAPRGLRWGGYLTLEYVDDTRDESYFDLHRLILSAEASLADRIDFAMEVEIEHGGISDEISGEIVLEKAEVSSPSPTPSTRSSAGC
jgi:hypothetical protein